VRFVLLPGQRHDTVGVPPLIEGIAFGALLGDKAFDVDWLRAELDARGAVAVIPPRAGRKAVIACDRAMYRWRHLIENCFAKLKEFRAVATRYDKTDGSWTPPKTPPAWPLPDDKPLNSLAPELPSGRFLEVSRIYTKMLASVDQGV
jgi:transposase